MGVANCVFVCSCLQHGTMAPYFYYWWNWVTIFSQVFNWVWSCLYIKVILSWFEYYVSRTLMPDSRCLLWWQGKAVDQLTRVVTAGCCCLQSCRYSQQGCPQLSHALKGSISLLSLCTLNVLACLFICVLQPRNLMLQGPQNNELFETVEMASDYYTGKHVCK